MYRLAEHAKRGGEGRLFPHSSIGPCRTVVETDKVTVIIMEEECGTLVTFHAALAAHCCRLCGRTLAKSKFARPAQAFRSKLLPRLNNRFPPVHGGKVFSLYDPPFGAFPSLPLSNRDLNHFRHLVADLISLPLFCLSPPLSH